MPGATIGPDKEIFDLKLDDYSKVMDLNLWERFCQHWFLAKHLRSKVTASDQFSMSSTQALTRVLGYSNAKAAIDNFTRWMATEMALKYGDQVRKRRSSRFFISKQNKDLNQ